MARFVRIVPMVLLVVAIVMQAVFMARVAAGEVGAWSPVGKQAISRINLILAEGRGKDQGPGDPEVQGRIKEALDVWYRDSVKSRLSEATTDDTHLSCAVADYLQWWKAESSILMGAGAGDGPYAREHARSLRDIDKAFEYAIGQAEKRCREKHDLTQVSVMFARARSQALLMARESSAEAILDRIRKVARFELVMESRITYKPSNIVAHIKTDKVALEMYPTGETDTLSRYYGAGRIGFMDVRGGPAPVKWEYKVSGGRLYVPSAVFRLGQPERIGCDCATKGSAPSPREADDDGRNAENLIISPVFANENLKMTAGRLRSNTNGEATWLEMFRILHGDEMVDGQSVVGSVSDDNFLIRNLEMAPKGGRLFARKTYQRSTELFDEATTLDIFHAPK